MDAEALFRLNGTVRRDPGVERWLSSDDPLRQLAGVWFRRMRDCGEDVRETLGDGHPMACVGDAAFAYVDAFKAHVNVGFFRGATLDDPVGLLEGTGKRMRHVKLRWGKPVDEAALTDLVTAACDDMRARLALEKGGR
jgi:hypothetical protein